MANLLSTAKCVDTYIAMSALHNPPVPVSKTNQAPPQLSTSFGGATGAASTSASLASPITPFSQSALPSKSLLSREDSNAFDPTTPGGGNAGVTGSHPSPMILQRNVQKNLQSTIRRIFESCYETGNYKQVVGIAIEARNLDVLRQSILRASQDEKKSSGKKPATGTPTDSEDLMEYVLDICMNVVQERGLRNDVCVDLIVLMP
jgi:26S proteasome regulatory subunit N2